MENLMKDKVEIEDEILKYCQEILAKDYRNHSGLTMVTSEELEANRNTAIQYLQDLKNQSWGILQDEVSKMHIELERLLNVFLSFYTSKLGDSDSTPQQINHTINDYLTRIKRMDSVLDPEYSVIKSFDKKSNHYYDMIRGYSIDDRGKRIRNLSRNVGNTEASIKDLIEKIFKLNSKNVVVYQPENAFNMRPDLIVSDGKTKWVVEVKLKDKQNYIKSFVSFELWKMYKEKYELME